MATKKYTDEELGAMKDEDILETRRKEGESYEEYKERREKANTVLNTRLNNAESAGGPFGKMPSRKARRRKGNTLIEGNQPFVNHGKQKLSKAEKKRYKKERQRFKTLTKQNAHKY